MRTLNIHATRGGAAQTITTSATTLGEITSDLRGLGIDVNNVQVINQATRSVLASSASSLPEGDGTLFIIPKKTKSGQYVNVSALYDQLASAVAEKGELQQEISNVDLNIVNIQKQIQEADSYGASTAQPMQASPHPSWGGYSAPQPPTTPMQSEFDALMAQGGY